MAKNTFERVMKNVNLKNDEHKPARTRDRISIEVVVDPSDKLLINNAMKNELHYYNTLVSHFASRIKSFPEHILSIDDRWEEIYLLISETMFDVNQLYNMTKKEITLPTKFEPYRDLLLPKNQAGKIVLNERMLLLVGPASGAGNIVARTRKAIALEVLKFYKEQAKLAIQTVGGEDVYRSAPETLLPVTLEQKKHIQLLRDSVSVTWDEVTECSMIKIPYANKPIKVPGFNLVEESFWNHLLIHQEPRNKITPSTPWLLELQNLKGSKYLVKYFESKRVDSGKVFHQAKRR